MDPKENIDLRSAKQRITDIHCPTCGAPAAFDIIRQQYLCGYCGGKVGIKEAQLQKAGFREFQKEQLQNSVKHFKLFRSRCSGCGAEVVFEEGEALSNCAFCGRSLVRTEYVNTKNMPESVIPFGLTEAEARDRLAAWCSRNKGKREAKKLLPMLDELKGFYLPYELIRGPIHMSVSRMDGGSRYICEGFMRDEFVNRSKQLDNLLLDGMEPFDLEGMTAFDFAYVAGNRVKTPDITEDVLKTRISQEAAEAYMPAVRRTLETKAVEVSADAGSVVRLPVLLPVYYISKDGLMAAVNGQTGKVSVRAEKESHYFFTPWWLKAILATIVFSAAFFGILYLFKVPMEMDLLLTGVLALFFIIVTLCLYSDTTRNSFSIESGREIFTSGEKIFHRERGKLVVNDKILERKVDDPVFFYKVEGKEQPAILRFTSVPRVLQMALLCIVAIFLPVILALLVNGFDFSRLSLGGSAVWFCIMVPVVPIYLLKFGIVQLYEKPWVYLLTEDGKKKRYRKKLGIGAKQIIKTVLRLLFKPPVCFAVWGGVLVMSIMVYLTAYGL